MPDVRGMMSAMLVMQGAISAWTQGLHSTMLTQRSDKEPTKGQLHAQHLLVTVHNLCFSDVVKCSFQVKDSSADSNA